MRPDLKELYERIDHYGHILKKQGKLTPTWLAWEVMGDLNDIDLEDWEIDITDVANVCLRYIEKGGKF